MTSDDAAEQIALFVRTLDECRELYVSSGRLCAQEYPHLLSKSGDEFVQLMVDLHRALVLKVYLAICGSDRRWSAEERQLAGLIFERFWHRRLESDALREAVVKASHDITKLSWYSIVRPFDRIAPLRDQIGTLETLVMRMANIVARVDGRLHPQEAAAIRTIQQELDQHLRAIPIDDPHEHAKADKLGPQAIEQLQDEADHLQRTGRRGDGLAGQTGSGERRGRRSGGGSRSPADTADRTEAAEKAAEERLEEALAELDALIGLTSIKREVRTLINFLKFQQRREEAALPETDISLHMVFTGNPGTGKTTVARIVGKLFGAMGVLQQGHLVETDRSGLVAEYAGQTGPKTNAKVDEALGGVLFIDEAYSLVADEGDDPYGREAAQALLKRVEDDRERLVVILAGYPAEMEKLLGSNPGLSSRFGRRFHFDDFSPVELARVFAHMCDRNHYRLTPQTRARLLVGLTELHARRDRHFGNGRAVRNLFEQAIRAMANRLANLPELSHQQLMLLEAADVRFDAIPAGDWAAGDLDQRRFRIECPGCNQTSSIPGAYLGRNVRCRKCDRKFDADWGEVVGEGG